jgi:stage V sporulation protein AD
MTVKKNGQTLVFSNPPAVLATAAVVGPKEGEGPLSGWFDVVKPDRLLGMKSWERAECKMVEEAVTLALGKAKVAHKDLDFYLGGDLLHQIITSSFAARSIDVPFFGLYGACATIAEALCLAAVLVDGGFATYVALASSSHHDTAERQFRFPTEFGVQRPVTAQYTVTAVGAAVVGPPGKGKMQITHATVGRVVDYGQKDPMDLGAAMAPAAADTILAHFQDTGRAPESYDLILTGDLASVGHPLCVELLRRAGLVLDGRFVDCGMMLYDETQETVAGGSGCGCSASVFAGYLARNLEQGKFRRILLVATGALHSTTSAQQGESIPCIAHAIVVERSG